MPDDKQKDMKTTAKDGEQALLDTFCLLKFTFPNTYTGSLPQHSHSPLDVMVQSDRKGFANADCETGQLHKCNPEVLSNEEIFE